MTDREQGKDRFRDRLSEYLDGNLGAAEEVLLEQHLDTCEDCARMLLQLEAVVDRAASVGSREPSEDLWPGVAARIAAPTADDASASSNGLERPAPRRPATRGLARFAPQLAAGVALVWLSGALVWMAMARDDIEGTPGGADAVPGLAAPSLRAPGVQNAATLEGAGSRAEEYADLISELERVLFDAERPLPPETVARIRRALVTIDRAIEDARAALSELPDDPYLQEHMENTMRRKSEFLAQAVQLAATD